MATEPVVRWSRAERRARVANGFEKPDRIAVGMAVQVGSLAPGGGFTQAHLQEAWELGRRSAR